jgi:hypothetical protein
LKYFIVSLYLLLLVSFVYSLDDYGLFLGLYSDKNYNLFEIVKNEDQYFIKNIDPEYTAITQYKIIFYKKSNDIYFKLDSTSDEIEHNELKFVIGADPKKIMIISVSENSNQDSAYKVIEDLDRNATINKYARYSGFVNDMKDYYLSENHDCLFYIYSDYPDLKVIRFKLNNFMIIIQDESVIYLKNNDFYSVFDKKENIINIKNKTGKINDKITYGLWSHFVEKFDQKKYGNNLVLARYSFNQINNIQLANYTGQINDRYYKRSFIIVTLFGIFLFSDYKPSFDFVGNVPFLKIPNGCQGEDLMIENYWERYLEKVDDFPEKLILNYRKTIGDVFRSVDYYKYDIEYTKMH